MRDEGNRMASRDQSLSTEKATPKSAATDLGVAELLARVEAATGPDRELDASLAIWAFPALATWPRTELGGWQSPEWGLIAAAELYTASLDAALALVEQALPGWWWAVGHYGPHGLSTATVSSDGKNKEYASEAATPALAMLAALLRALGNAPPSDGGMGPATHEGPSGNGLNQNPPTGDQP